LQSSGRGREGGASGSGTRTLINSTSGSAKDSAGPSGTSQGTSQDLRAKAGEAASKLADVAQQAGGQARQAATSLASEANQKAKGFLNQKVTVGADFAGHIAESVKCAADNLDQNAPQLAGLVRGAADKVDGFSRDMREQTVEDLVRTASDFTRRQPALVFGLASLAGFFLFRVLKSNPSAPSEAGGYRDSTQRAGVSHGV
jgi:hypothetical protein